MIKLFNNKTCEPVSFEITKFPDGTSQVWKLNPEPKSSDNFLITWMFENESEFVHVLQLCMLLHQVSDETSLYVPFLPYGRQDKEITNNSTFALWPMIGALGAFVKEIISFDVHSNTFDSIRNIPPDHFFKTVLYEEPSDRVIVFPDKGAQERYGHLFGKTDFVVVGSKVRDQSTGEITGMSIDGDLGMISNRRCIIFDDICDGGMTFIKIAEKLQEFEPYQIDLCVSHGIFSKGVEVIHNSGIDRIFTTNSLLKNTGYDVLKGF